MLVFARRPLADPCLARSAAAAAGPMLLLEGAWADDEAGGDSPPWCHRFALDTAVDGRFARLDVEAERITDEIISAAARHNPAGPNFAELNALRLRYAVVKWLRPIAWWRASDVNASSGPVRLVIESPRDAEYETLFRQLAEAHGFPLTVESPGDSATPPIALPQNPFWRRLAGRMLTRSRPSGRRSTAPRVLLSGNPRLLDPICAELANRGATVAWLYDRFSFGCRRRWHRRGVAQLVCDSSLGRSDPFPRRLVDEPLHYEGVDLTPVVNVWYADLRRSLASSQARLWSQIGRHVESFRPDHVVVDEDATPQARAAVLQGRRFGAASAVVQHGICGVRFGFAPLLADRFCAWDDGSRRQLEAWNVPAERIAVTGSPYQDRIDRQARDALSAFACAGVTMKPLRPSAPRILLIGTIPPRDDRPDSIAYHLTTRNYETLLDAALAAVAEIPHDELAIRNHPRSGVDTALRRVLTTYSDLRVRDTSSLPIASDLAMTDVVLSFPSSGALDAVRLGKPVIQLVPTDSHQVAPAEWYGFFGSAGTLPELRKLLATLLATLPAADHASPAPPPNDTQGDASRRVVDAILQVGNAQSENAPAKPDSPPASVVEATR
jgi:hypothetical protein